MYCCYSTIIKKVLVHHWFLHIMLGSFDFVFINISKQSRIHGKYSMYSVFSFGRAFITWWNIMWWYFSVQNLINFHTTQWNVPKLWWSLHPVLWLVYTHWSTSSLTTSIHIDNNMYQKSKLHWSLYHCTFVSDFQLSSCVI